MGELIPKVVHVFPNLRPGGGPAGYGFNLLHALTLVGADEMVTVLSPSQPANVGITSGGSSQTSKKFQLLQRLPPWIAGSLLALRTLRILQDSFRYFRFTREQVKEIELAKVVIFHDYRLASTYLRKGSKHPAQKALIMPHSPTDLTSELVENWRVHFGSSRVWSSIRRMLIGIELRTLLASDGLIVPCRSSLDHYFEGVAERQDLFRLPIYEIKSGVPEKVARRGRKEVLAQWGVPPESKVVGYFGRRHPHKGYDLFCHAAEVAHEKGYESLIFVAAGSGPLPSPSHLPNFRDLGYLTTELAEAVAAVDLVVVPNRVSYFDLFILEAMSLGKAILTSRVGGNLCLGSPGIFFLEQLTPESLVLAIVKLLSDPRNLEEMGRLNRKIYEEHYSPQAFAKRHVEFAQSILGSNSL